MGYGPFFNYGPLPGPKEDDVKKLITLVATFLVFVVTAYGQQKDPVLCADCTYGYQQQGTRHLVGAERAYYGSVKTTNPGPYSAKPTSTDRKLRLGDVEPAMGDQALFEDYGPDGTAHLVTLGPDTEVFKRDGRVYAWACENLLVYRPNSPAKPEKETGLTDPCEGRVLTAQFVSLGPTQNGTHIRLIQATGSNPVGQVTWSIQPQAGATVTATNATNEWVVSGTVFGTLKDACGSSTATFTEELVEVPVPTPAPEVKEEPEWGPSTPRYREVVYQDVYQPVYQEYLPSAGVSIDFSFGFVPGWIQYNFGGQNCWVAPGCSPPAGWQCPSQNIVNNYINIDNSVTNNYYNRKRRHRPDNDPGDDDGFSPEHPPTSNDFERENPPTHGLAANNGPREVESDRRSPRQPEVDRTPSVRNQPERTGSTRVDALVDQARNRAGTQPTTSRYGSTRVGSTATRPNGNRPVATQPNRSGSPQTQPSRTPRQDVRGTTTRPGSTTRPSVPNRQPSRTTQPNRSGSRPSVRPSQGGRPQGGGRRSGGNPRG